MMYQTRMRISFFFIIKWSQAQAVASVGGSNVADPGKGGMTSINRG